jgi:DNA replication protein DnaC
LLRKPRFKDSATCEYELDKVFADFKTLDDPELEKALKQARLFCRDMASGNKPARWITLLGRSGVGKTMLAKRIARFFARYLDFLPDERNRDGEVWTRRGGFKQWVDVVQDMIGGDYTGIPDLKHDWFLALDDIGAEYGGIRELAISKLYEILNARLGLWTVITGNLTFDGIAEKLDRRISSRLIRDGSTLLEIDVQDFNEREAA